MTTRGMSEPDMEAIATLLGRVVALAQDVQRTLDSKKLVDFLAAVAGDDAAQAGLKGVKHDAERLAKTFPLPGVRPAST